MDIRIGKYLLEGSGIHLVIPHQGNNWSLENAIPMAEESDAWVLCNAEQHLPPETQFKIAVLGIKTRSTAFTIYCNRNDRGLIIGGPPANHPDNSDLRVRKFFWNEEQKVMYLLAPGVDVYLTPGGNWNNRMPPMDTPEAA